MREGTVVFPILAIAATLFSWLLPNHYFPWVTFYSEILAFFTLLSMCCFTLLHRPLDLSWSSIILLFISVLPLVQWLCGIEIFLGDALIASLYLVGTAFAMAIGGSIRSIGGVKSFELVAWVAIVGSAVSVCIALSQWLHIEAGMWVVDLRPGGRPYANLAQPNNLATLLCLGLVSVLYLWERQRFHFFSANFVGLFLICGVVITQSRTPWLGGLVFLVWWAWKAESCGLRLSPRRVVAWVAGYAALVWVFPHVADSLYLSADSISERAQGMHRLELWWQLLHAVLNGGWWGYGWNQVSTAQVAVALDYPVSFVVEHSHNLLLDMLLWNGPLIGAVIILSGTFWLGSLAWRASSLENAFALLVVGLVLLHGMLEFPLEYAFFLLPVGVLLGMVEKEQGVRQVIVLPQWLGGCVVVAGGCLMGWVWSEYRIIEEDHRLMRFETAHIGTLEAEKAAPDVLLLSQLREFLRFARTEASINMSSEQLNWMRDVAHRYPYPPALFRYALALGLNHRYKDSAHEMMVLKGLHSPEHYEEALLALRSLSEKDPELKNVLTLLVSR